MSTRIQVAVRYVSLVVIAFAVVSLGAFAFFSTPSGRAWVLSMALNPINDAISGTVRIDELRSLSFTGLEASGLRLYDPNGAQVGRIARVYLEYDLSALLDRSIRLRKIVAREGGINARALPDTDRGLIAAIKPTGPSSSASDSFRIEIDRVDIDRFSLDLEIPSGEMVTMQQVSLAGSYRSDPREQIQIDRFDARITKNGTQMGTIGPLQVTVASDENNRFKGTVRLEDANINFALEAKRKDKLGWKETPFRASLSVNRLSTDTLRALKLFDFGERIAEPIDLELQVDGTIQKNRADIRFLSPAGTIQGHVKTQELKRARFVLATKAFNLSQLIVDIPKASISTTVEGSVQRVDDGLKYRVIAKNNAFNALRIPDIEAEGRRTYGSTHQLRVRAHGFGVTADLHTEIDSAGRASVHGRVDAADLGRLRDARVDRALGGSIRARIAATLEKNGVMRTKGDLIGRSLSVDAFALNALDISFKSDGPLSQPRISLSASGRYLRWNERVFKIARVYLNGGPSTYELRLDARSTARSIALQGRIQRGRRTTVVSADGFAVYRGKKWSTNISGLRFYDTAGFSLDRFNLSRGKTLVRANGAFGRSASDSLQIEVHNLELHDLTDLAGLKQPVKARFDGEAIVRGALERLVVQLRTELTNVRYRNHLDAQGSMSAQIDLERGLIGADLQLNDVENGTRTKLDLEGTLPKTRGFIKQLKYGDYRLAASVRKLNVTQISAVAPKVFENLQGELSLDITAEGTLAEPRVEAGLKAFVRTTTEAGCGSQPLEIDGRLKLQEAQWNLGVDAKSDKGDFVEAVARGAFQSPQDRLWRFQDAVRLNELALSLDRAQLGDLPVICEHARGRLSGRAEIVDISEALAFRLTLDLKELSVDEIPPVDGKLLLRSDAQQMDFSLDLFDEHGLVDARFALPIEWRGRVFSLAIDRAVVGSLDVQKWSIGWFRALLSTLREKRKHPQTAFANLDGRISVQGDLSGTLVDPRLKLNAQTNLRTPFGNFDTRLAASWSQRKGRVRSIIRDKKGEWLEAVGDLWVPESFYNFVEAWPQSLAATHWSVDLRANTRPLSRLPIALAPELHSESIQVSGRARLQRRSRRGIGGSLSAELISGGQRVGAPNSGCAQAPGRLKLAATLDRGQLQVRLNGMQERKKVMVLDARSRLALENLFSIKPQKTLPLWTVEGYFDQTDLSRIPLLCQKARGELSGKFAAKQLSNGIPQVKGRFLARGFSLGSHSGLNADLDFVADPDRISVKTDLKSNGSTSRLYAHLPLSTDTFVPKLACDKPIAVRAMIRELPISPLLPRDGPITYATGNVNGSLELRGSVKSPRVKGALRLNSVGLVITELAQPLRDIKGKIVFSNRDIRLQGLTARDQGGTFRVDGRIALVEESEFRVKMKLVARDFPVRKEGQAFAKLDMSADVSGAGSAEKNAFDIDLRDTLVWLSSDPLRSTISLEPHPDMARVEKDGIAKPKAGVLQPVSDRATDLRVRASEPVWIQRDDFAFQVTTKLRIRIRGGRARIVGPVFIRRGFLELFGQTFEIEQGSTLKFTNAVDPNPSVQLVARHTRTRNSNAVRVRVTGRARDPKLVFTVGDRDRIVTAGEALDAIQGGSVSASGADQQSRAQMTSVLSGAAAGILAVSVRREIGSMLPVLTVESGEDSAVERVRAGVQLNRVVPEWLYPLVQGVYAEGIVGSGQTAGDKPENYGSGGVQGGVLIELDFPHDLVGSGQYGPGDTWSVDLGWEP